MKRILILLSGVILSACEASLPELANSWPSQYETTANNGLPSYRIGFDLEQGFGEFAASSSEAWDWDSSWSSEITLLNSNAKSELSDTPGSLWSLKSNDDVTVFISQTQICYEWANRTGAACTPNVKIIRE